MRSLAQGGGALAIASTLVFSGVAAASADEGAADTAGTAGAESSLVAAGSPGPDSGPGEAHTPAVDPPAGPPAERPAPPADPPAQGTPADTVPVAPPPAEEVAAPPSAELEPSAVHIESVAEATESGPGEVAAQADNEQVCEGLTTGQVDAGGDQTSITITAPEGQLIDRYCVKAGSAQQGEGPVYVDVVPPAASVTIMHPSGKEISHYSVSYIAKPPVNPPPPPGPPPSGPPPAGPPPAGPPPAGPPPAAPPAAPPQAPVMAEAPPTQPLAATGVTIASVRLFAAAATLMLAAGVVLFVRARRAVLARS